MAPKRPEISTDLFAQTVTTEQAPRSERGQAEKPTSSKAHKRKSKAATFYFAPEVLDRLELTWLDLRRELGSVSKSAIVEAALVAALDDLDKSGTASKFASMLASQ